MYSIFQWVYADAKPPAPPYLAGVCVRSGLQRTPFRHTFVSQSFRNTPKAKRYQPLCTVGGCGGFANAILLFTFGAFV